MSIYVVLAAARLVAALSLTGQQLRGEGREKILTVVDSHGAPTAPGSASDLKTQKAAAARGDGGDAPTEQDLKNFSGDWLFHVRTTSCHGDVFDNGTYTATSRAFLPLLCGVCVILVASTRHSAGKPRAEERGEGGEASTEAASTRLWHVDFARICAVMCVIFEHSGGETYTHRNVGFGLWWALPYLYITSGMSSMMSKSSLWGYVIRLVVVFTAGVSANLFADLVKHRDWRHDFGNTIFQMFFVIMLLIMAPLAEPLRQALRSRQEGQSVSRATVAFTVFWGAVSAVALASFVRGYTGDSPDFVTQTFEDEEVSRWIKLYAPILRHTPIILVHVAGTLFLGLLATILCQPENTGLVGWVLLAFTYLQMVIVPWDQDSFAHLVNLNIAGMLTFQWPLAGSKHIAAAVKAYWPFLLMFLCLDSMPDMWGRCDVHSPYSTWERFRMFLGELILVVCFMAGAFTPSDPHRITSWLGQWSLYAYCFHVMWYRLLGSPYGAIVTFAGMPLFWAMAACVPQKANAK
eukprot:CAMPEP_0181518120 /NCGR_PEP_ID=MMETSP1110-20121109/65086_1 /TAXON_ID=174948 /ORGANISM="Symbiodinium sp., Strain CCMP421" /LENGTH=519 /DNA_ID=CAMNT_0023648479 /DNA_START=29 /DNA_END=1588 /DNA_ORIENTATION=-